MSYVKPVKPIHIVRLVYSVCLAVITGLLAQATLRIGPVPYTMQNVGIVLAGLVLPPGYALLSQLLYLLLIAIGLPMGAGFRGGLHVILGFTGGYLAGFPISAALMSVLRRWYLRRRGTEMCKIGIRDSIVLLLLSGIAVIPTYVLGFLVFSYYALGNERLFAWASSAANMVGISGDKLAILFTASVLIFIPQDLLMDHVIAIGVAKGLARFLKSRGIEVE